MNREKLITDLKGILNKTVIEQIDLGRIYYNDKNYEYHKKNFLDFIGKPQISEIKDSVVVKSEKGKNLDVLFCDYAIYVLNDNSYFITCEEYETFSDDWDTFLVEHKEHIETNTKEIDLIICVNFPKLLDLGFVSIDFVTEMVRNEHIELLLSKGLINPLELTAEEVKQNIKFLLANGMIDKSMLGDDIIDEFCIELLQANLFSEQEIEEKGIRLMIHKKQLAKLADASKHTK